VFAGEGASVFLASRTAAKRDAVAEKIRSAGGLPTQPSSTCYDERAMDEHADSVAAQAGVSTSPAT
jgi:hypothetical protein